MSRSSRLAIIVSVHAYQVEDHLVSRRFASLTPNIHAPLIVFFYCIPIFSSCKDFFALPTFRQIVRSKSIRCLPSKGTLLKASFTVCSL